MNFNPVKNIDKIANALQTCKYCKDLVIKDGKLYNGNIIWMDIVSYEKVSGFFKDTYKKIIKQEGLVCYHTAVKLYSICNTIPFDKCYSYIRNMADPNCEFMVNYINFRNFTVKSSCEIGSKLINPTQINLNGEITTPIRGEFNFKKLEMLSNYTDYVQRNSWVVEDVLFYEGSSIKLIISFERVIISINDPSSAIKKLQKQVDTLTKDNLLFREKLGVCEYEPFDDKYNYEQMKKTHKELHREFKRVYRISKWNIEQSHIPFAIPVLNKTN